VIPNVFIVITVWAVKGLADLDLTPYFAA